VLLLQSPSKIHAPFPTPYGSVMRHFLDLQAKASSKGYQEISSAGLLQMEADDALT
jgi:hypothetical protein